MIPLSVIIITKNEEHNISDCLHSVRWAKDIVIVDAESKDATVEKAKQYTHKIFIKPWLGFAEAKTFAVQHTECDWVLWLDADERVTEELAQEIQQLLQEKIISYNSYFVARRAYFLGRWIKHSGWYPGRVVRLFHKNYAAFNSAAVHEGLEIKGESGILRNDLLHFTDPNLHHYFEKFNRYTTLASQELFSQKRKFRLVDLLLRPSWLFCKMYIIKLGFLDGIQGFILAIISSVYVFTKYAKLWEQWKNKN